MANVPSPCEFSPNLRIAQRLARFYVDRVLAGAHDILELAPGQGVLMLEAQHRGLRIRGVDSDTSVVEHCRDAGLDIVQADAIEYLDQTQDTYDAVVALHLIEHLDTTHAEYLFGGARRICRPGGKLLLATPNFADPVVSGELFWLDTQTGLFADFASESVGNGLVGF